METDLSNIGNRYQQLWQLEVGRHADYANALLLAMFKELAEREGYKEQIELLTKPWQLQNNDTATNFDNLIRSVIASSSTQKIQKENEEIMQKIKQIKNARIRADGRFEWRKMINRHPYQIIERDFNIFAKKVSQMNKDLKQLANDGICHHPKLSLYQITVEFYERVIKGQFKHKTIKASSNKLYANALKYLVGFNRPIKDYIKDDFIDFFNTIEHHRMGAYCYFLLKRVFADALEKGTITRNPFANLKNPFSQKRCGQKGSWLNIQEQKLLKANLTNSVFSKEILFYLVTGCRLREAYDAEIDFNKCMAKITRHKTEYSGVKCTYIPLSPSFCNLIKNDWDKMFKIRFDNLTKKISEFLRKIGIKDKSTHDLRHTFSSNLYYLGIDPKKQQYLMGHTNIQQTYDTYTTLDMTVTAQDIRNIWGDLYPEY